jgi:hypothetical protein
LREIPVGGGDLALGHAPPPDTKPELDEPPAKAQGVTAAGGGDLALGHAPPPDTKPELDEPPAKAQGVTAAGGGDLAQGHAVITMEYKAGRVTKYTIFLSVGYC